MNPWLIAAAALVFIIGLVHSWLGERLVFRHLRRGGLVPDGGQPGLREYQTRILWASWHVVTALAWALSVVLLWLAQPAVQALSGGGVETATATALGVSGGLVLLSNRGRHPAWIALLAAAALVLMSYR